VRRWSGTWPRRRAEGVRQDASGAGQEDPAGESGIHVEEIDGVHVVRAAREPALDPLSIAELGHAMAVRGGTTVTVVIATADERAWEGLEEVLRGQPAGSFREILLVLSHAAASRRGQPSAARSIAERWDVRVIAPDGAALLVPGGSLFVLERPYPDVAGAGDVHGWWRFSPGGEPEPLGRQLPAPSWQAALDRLPRTASASGETAVHRIPAGVVLRPLDAPAPLPGDLAFAVPVGPDRPVVLVGAPGDGVEVPPRDVVRVLSSLPPPVRATVRLAPGGNTDLLAAGQSAADAFGIEVEVLTGSPLMTDGQLPGAEAHQARAVLIGTDGTPAWRPFVEAVACRPRGDGPPVPPRLLRWQPPLPGVGSARTGVLRLSDSWQVAVARSGLRITRAGTAPTALPERPVDADAPAIELGTPGQALGQAALPALRTLLAALSPEVRERAVLHLYGDCGTEQTRELSRVLSEHGVKRLRTKPPQAAARRPGSPAAVRPLPATPRPEVPGPRPDDLPVPARPPHAGRAALPPAPDHTRANRTPSAPVPAAPRPPASGEPASTAAPAAVPPTTRRPVRIPPLGPGYRSSEAEREAFRALVPDEVWNRQEAATGRMPGRSAADGAGERAPNPVDALAVHLYLTVRDGPLGHQALAAALRAGDPRMVPYAACLASGLGAMVPYRGPAFRSGDALTPAQSVPGRLLRAPGPLSALTTDLRGPSAITRYAVWSENGRRADLMADGTQPDADTDAQAPDEVVFAPGTAFRVLGVRKVRGADVVLLRDLPADAAEDASPGDEQDRAALLALTEALEEGVPTGSRDRVRHWPVRCSGPPGWE
jgi:hypothetical protein